MKSIRKRYYQTLFILIPVMCTLCIGLSLWTIQQAETVFASETFKQIFVIKKIFLKDTVQNIVREIDAYRANYRGQAVAEIDRLADALDQQYRKSPAAFQMSAMNLLSLHKSDSAVRFQITNSHGNTLLANPTLTSEASGPSHVRHLSYGVLEIDFWINQSEIDKQAKWAIREAIHNKLFDEDSYVWVNEIINFDGGDSYAIRRIHPNLVDTEGSFLSTKLEDIKGNTPYLTELEGIKKDGEVLFSYWFKRKDSQAVAEKLTYARLYRDFNWVIAMGIHLEDTQSYIDKAKTRSMALSSQIITIAFVSMLVLFLMGLIILAITGKYYMRRTKAVLLEESNKDSLTGIYNRRLGNVYLEEAIGQFRKETTSPALIFFDIDDFKKINDTWGHKVGDMVLKQVVERVSQAIRSGDKLCRWGGEEFLIIAEGVTPENAETIAAKLNALIAQNPVRIDQGYPAEEMEISVSVSIGVGWFEKTDRTPEDALQRVDSALYLAKKDGKNCARLADLVITPLAS
jgi:diguanylate cyclase (GGDEF)-like protein